MTEPVHQIGMTELYNEIRSLSERFTEFTNRQGIESAQFNHKISELEKDLAEMKSELKAESIRRSTQGWQLKMAFLTSVLFPILVAVVMGILMAKGV